MKIALQIILVFVILGLGWLVYQSVQEPIVFQEKYEKRKAAVVERLKIIRDAQVAYKASNEKYASTFDTLITFVKTGNYKITKNEGTLTDSMLQAGMTEKEAIKLGIISRDTVYVSVKDSICKNLNPDSLEYVPYSNGAKFELGASSITTSSGLVIPVFEASVANKVFLQGLDNQERINLDETAKQLNRYPGLKVGSLEEANNNAGNWE
ncbi:MAG: hypothetical protein HUJ96_10455 [Marinilabiliaceae bacterium]|nr:hypothetical protein [Marinilabiliaceae bacterium]